MVKTTSTKVKPGGEIKPKRKQKRKPKVLSRAKPQDNYPDGQCYNQNNVAPQVKVMATEMASNQSGYSWTIKDLVPLLVTVCTCAFGIFQVYNALTIRMTAMEKDVEFLKESTNKELTYIKASVQSLNEKIDGLTKSNETIKLQLHDVANSIKKGNR